MRTLPLLAAIAAAQVALSAPVPAETKLLMLHEPWCEWCEKWEEEIGVAYGKTEEGRRAPLERVRLSADLPRGIELDRPARITPTFVLLDDGREVGRLEGYAGAHFFYPMLNDLLDRLPGDTAQAATEGDPHETD